MPAASPARDQGFPENTDSLETDTSASCPSSEATKAEPAIGALSRANGERRRDESRQVASVFLWANGMVMVFGDDGEQIPELQGAATTPRLEEIRRASTPATAWFGFGEDGPLVAHPPPTGTGHGPAVEPGCPGCRLFLGPGAERSASAR